MRSILNTSGRFGPNIMDYLRSIYFTLLTGTIFVLLNKISSYNSLSISLLLTSCSSIIYGLWQSVKITNRYKGYEKDFEKDSSIDKDLKANKYYANRDSKFRKEHTKMYWFFAPSILLIGAGIWVGEVGNAKKFEQSKQLLIDLSACRQNASKKKLSDQAIINQLSNQLKGKQDSVTLLKNQITQLKTQYSNSAHAAQRIAH